MACLSRPLFWVNGPMLSRFFFPLGVVLFVAHNTKHPAKKNRIRLTAWPRRADIFQKHILGSTQICNFVNHAL